MHAPFPAHCSLCSFSQPCQGTHIFLVPSPTQKVWFGVALNKQLWFQPPGSTRSWEHSSRGEYLYGRDLVQDHTCLEGFWRGSSLLHISGLLGVREGAQLMDDTVSLLGAEWPESTPMEADLRLSKFPWRRKAQAEGRIQASSQIQRPSSKHFLKTWLQRRSMA